MMQNNRISLGLGRGGGRLSLGRNLLEMVSVVLYTLLDKITMPSFHSHCILFFAILLNTFKFQIRLFVN